MIRSQAYQRGYKDGFEEGRKVASLDLDVCVECRDLFTKPIGHRANACPPCGERISKSDGARVLYRHGDLWELITI